MQCRVEIRVYRFIYTHIGEIKLGAPYSFLSQPLVQRISLTYEATKADAIGRLQTLGEHVLLYHLVDATGRYLSQRATQRGTLKRPQNRTLAVDVRTKRKNRKIT